MAIGLSGMVSGMDTDTLIKQLMSAERTRVTKVENKITTAEWAQEKWKDLNTKIYGLYTGSLAKMKTQGNYLTKKTTSSNDKVVTVKAGASAPIGTHYVEVRSVASAQYVTSGTFTSAEKLTVASKLTDAGVAAGTKISLACGDKSAELVVDENTTFSDFTEACKDAGLNVNFDEARQCLYISSRQSGTENLFTLTTSVQNSTSKTALTGIRSLAGFDAMSAADKTSFDEALKTIEQSDSAAIDAVLLKAEAGDELTEDESALLAAYNRITEAVTAHTAKTKATEEIEGAIVAELRDAIMNGTAVTMYGREFTEELAQMTQSNMLQVTKEEYEAETFASFFDSVPNAETFANTNYAEIQALKEKPSEELTTEESELLDAYLALEAEFEAELGTYTEENGYDTAAYASMYENAVQAFAENEMNSFTSLEETVTAITERTDEILADSADPEVVAAGVAVRDAITVYANTLAFDPAGDGLAAIGLANVDGTAQNASANAVGMSVYAAGDAEISVNGADITSGSNNITVNGLTLDLISAAPGETISVNVSQDTDSVYNMVKQFVKDYNALIEEMNGAYYAESARGYDPLTDEQRDAMSETEADKWDKKIKDSLLRRDNTLSSLLTAMRSTLNESVEVDGKAYSLSSFGICTTKYTEKGKLHIYGDQEDSEGMTYEDKLRKAIEEDPEKVMEVLQGISKKLYDTMADKMKASEISSALTFYNDKQMTKDMTSYKKELSKQEDRLKEIEDRYYKQFASMETALSKLSSQSSTLLSMLGTGNQR